MMQGLLLQSRFGFSSFFLTVGYLSFCESTIFCWDCLLKLIGMIPSALLFTRQLFWLAVSQLCSSAVLCSAVKGSVVQIQCSAHMWTTLVSKRHLVQSTQKRKAKLLWDPLYLVLLKTCSEFLLRTSKTVFASMHSVCERPCLFRNKQSFYSARLKR